MSKICYKNEKKSTRVLHPCTEGIKSTREETLRNGGINEALKKKDVRNTSLKRPVHRLGHILSHSHLCHVPRESKTSTAQLDGGVCILVLLGPGRFGGDEGGFAVGSPCKGTCDGAPTWATWTWP